MILYLHGFRSSPKSFKAQLMAQAIKDHGLEHMWYCPQLPPSPAQALNQCREWIQTTAAKHNLTPKHDLTIIGSSLGGYYASSLAEEIQCRAVVLNPSINPMKTLKDYIGTLTYYHSDEPFEFRPEHLKELEAIAPPKPSDPSRYYLLACTGDEILDWREMADWFKGSHGRVIEGSDHGISDFEKYMPDVLNFVLNKT